MRPDWGSVPAWLALAGGLSAALSYVAGRRDQRRLPATQVYLMVLRGEYVLRMDDKPRLGIDAQIVNDSPLPLYDIHVSIWNHGARRRPTWRLREPAHRMTTNRVSGGVVTGMWPSSRSVELPFNGPIDRIPKAMTGTAWAISLEFRDGNGRRWIRWPDGRLTRLRLSRGAGPRSHLLPNIADDVTVSDAVDQSSASPQQPGISRDGE